MGVLVSTKRWAHGKQKLIGVFHPDPFMAQLALEALEWTLLDRGMVLSEEILEKAFMETEKYPMINIRDFVAGISNKQLQDSLKGL